MRQPRTTSERRAQLDERQLGNLTDSDGDFSDTDDGFFNRNVRNRLASARRRHARRADKRQLRDLTDNDSGVNTDADNSVFSDTDDGFFNRNRLSGIQRRRKKNKVQRRQVPGFNTDSDNGNNSNTDNDGAFSDTDDGLPNRNRLPAGRPRPVKRSEKRQIPIFTDDESGNNSNTDNGGLSDTDDGFPNRNQNRNRLPGARRRVVKRAEKRQIPVFTDDDSGANTNTDNDGVFSDSDGSFFKSRTRTGVRRRRVNSSRRLQIEPRTDSEPDSKDPAKEPDSEDDAKPSQSVGPPVESPSPVVEPAPISSATDPVLNVGDPTSAAPPADTSAGNSPTQAPIVSAPAEETPSASEGVIPTPTSDVVGQITDATSTGPTLDLPTSTNIGTGAEQAGSAEGITSGNSGRGLSRGAAVGIAFGTIGGLAIIIAAVVFFIRWRKRRLDDIFDRPPPAGLERSNPRTDTLVMDRAMRAVYANELGPDDKLFAGQETLDQRSIAEREVDQAHTPVDQPAPVLPVPVDNASGRGSVFRNVNGWLQKTTSVFSQRSKDSMLFFTQQNEQTTGPPPVYLGGGGKYQ